MNRLFPFATFLAAGIPLCLTAAEAPIILDSMATENLGIELVEADYRDFEQTVFAIGRLEEIPETRSVVSSRIPGRVSHLDVFEGDRVEAGQTVMTVESRQLGNPPPSIELTAPNGGLVVRSRAQLGQPVSPETELMEIVDRSRLWAVAQVPESVAAGLKVGTPARVEIPAVGGEPREVSLTRFGVDADPLAGTVTAIFEMDNSDGRLRPGLRAEFSIVVDRQRDVLAVPREAIQGDPARRVVFVKDFDLPHAFHRVPVVVGAVNDRFAEIESGLFPSDLVVTEGSYLLNFAGAGSGMSLKEALDAAHGHEHNEDGSEMTPEQRAARAAERAAAREGESAGERSGPDHWRLPLMIYAGVCTVLLLIAGQLLWNQKRRRAEVSDA
ncbi:MAG: efflux RND transporter periplasmic adaptor subunit [Puniceicoccales bacterium]